MYIKSFMFFEWNSKATFQKKFCNIRKTQSKILVELSSKRFNKRKLRPFENNHYDFNFYSWNSKFKIRNLFQKPWKIIQVMIYEIHKWFFLLDLQNLLCGFNMKKISLAAIVQHFIIKNLFKNLKWRIK